MPRVWLGLVFGVGLIGSRTAAADETYLTAEAPAALAVSHMQESTFRPGMMPAVGAYAGKAVGPVDVAVGARLRLGALRDGPAPGNNMADPGLGGMGSLGLALRVAYRGAWIEAVGGGGLTGGDLVPTLELGVGWMMQVGSIAIGPSARYVRVVSRDPMAAFGSADLALVGIDFRFGGAKKLPHDVLIVRRAIPPPPEYPEVTGSADPDHDAIAERETSCAEDVNGCLLAPDVFVADNKVVLDERVLFEFNRAHVHARGREAIAHLADVWHAHPEWQRIVIQGHADTRGTDEYNQWLSELRATRVRDVLLRHGFAPERVETAGFGCTHPRDPGHDEDAHQHNRRVEFVIVTATSTPRTM